MGEIRRFAPKPANDEEPSLSGEAVCLSCAHTWQAVTTRGAPVNSVDGDPGLECPACTSTKGVMRHFVQYTDVSSWHCTTCQSFLFSIILAKDNTPCLACACCGKLSNAIDVFNK